MLDIKISLEDLTPNVERDAKKELSKLQQAFRDRKKKEDIRNLDSVDSEYWVCLCFQNRKQREDFVVKSGIGSIDDKYVDGIIAANRLGITLDDQSYPKPQKCERG